jgi:hypothetical protein
MGIGLQAVELSPCHAGLAEPRFPRLLAVPGFVGMRLFPGPFWVREVADPRISSASFPSAMEMGHKLLRRTMDFQARQINEGADLQQKICPDNAIDGKAVVHCADFNVKVAHLQLTH